MEIKQDKYVAYSEFINNLGKNQDAMVEKLADAEDKVLSLKREKTITETILRDGNAAGKEDAKKAVEDRLSMVICALDIAEKEFQALLEQNTNLNPAPFAQAAVEEADGEILRLQIAFSESINLALEARQNLLKTITDIHHIMAAGKRAIEHGEKAQAHSPRKLSPHAMFDTGLSQFLVDLSAVKKAFYRGER